jgi:hypothetical protein
LRIPTTIPETPRSATIGKSTRDSPTARARSPPGSPNGRMIQGASRIRSAVRAPSPRSTSQNRLDATRQARRRSPFSSNSVKIGTNAEERAASATSARTRFGTWKATVKALTLPAAPK